MQTDILEEHPLAQSHNFTNSQSHFHANLWERVGWREFCFGIESSKPEDIKDGLLLHRNPRPHDWILQAGRLSAEILASIFVWSREPEKTQANYSSQIALREQPKAARLASPPCAAKPASGSELHFPGGTRCVPRRPGLGWESCLHRTDLGA